MATLIPSLNSCLARMTNGEKRFARRLESKLEDDYLLWYDVPVGPKRLHPDFIILHPRRGLLILEVKDWKADTVQKIDHSKATLILDGGVTEVSNPLEQARRNAQEVVNLLVQDELLRVPGGKRFQGKLVFPYGYGAVLTNISRKVFESSRLDWVLKPHRVICQDEMTESVDEEAFQEQLWGMFSYSFGHVLSLPQIERVRWHLFPEVRINPGQLSLFDVIEEDEEVEQQLPDLIRVLDLQQEQLARSLGEGHRVIHGVAGSGKTLILGYRCLHLANATRKPILVLCYNISLAARLQQLIEEKGVADRVHIYNFHKWCLKQLKIYHVPIPTSKRNQFYDDLVQQVIDAVQRNQIPSGQYGVVMVDEGHDFKPEWLKLVTQMVDPTTNSLLLLYDDAQSIYGRKQRRAFSLSSVGIQARGRTTILRMNYRNTSEVLSLAYNFAKNVIPAEEAGEDSIPIIEPESAGRHGPQPELLKLPNYSQEAFEIVERLKDFREKGIRWSEMAIVYRVKFVAERMIKQLKAHKIPFEWVTRNSNSKKYNPNEESIKIITMHSSKGLEFPVVAIPGVGDLPYGKESIEDEAKLFYVAMTRAMDHLIMTANKPSPFVKKIEQVSKPE